MLVEALLDSSVTGLVINPKFARKHGFKLKKIERPIYVRNLDSIFNKESPIEHTVEVKIFFKEHKKQTEINVIGGQNWSVILRMLWLAHHNTEINQKTDEVKMTRCTEECEKQWRLKQRKLEWQKAKEERSRRRLRKERRQRGTRERKREQ